ncbi:collagen alpha-2(I) chain-like [Dromaius novaehollandiae]|uniref:collagen alpha-2(I) chain-like n=1 Tax=Dromaius novaehollandiae TaxID=8790 RepID=UPI00311D75AE
MVEVVHLGIKEGCAPRSESDAKRRIYGAPLVTKIITSGGGRLPPRGKCSLVGRGCLAAPSGSCGWAAASNPAGAAFEDSDAGWPAIGSASSLGLFGPLCYRRFFGLCGRAARNALRSQSGHLSHSRWPLSGRDLEGGKDVLRGDWSAGAAGLGLGSSFPISGRRPWWGREESRGAKRERGRDGRGAPAQEDGSLSEEGARRPCATRGGARPSCELCGSGEAGALPPSPGAACRRRSACAGRGGGGLPHLPRRGGETEGKVVEGAGVISWGSSSGRAAGRERYPTPSFRRRAAAVTPTRDAYPSQASARDYPPLARGGFCAGAAGRGGVGLRGAAVWGLVRLLPGEAHALPRFGAGRL